MQSLKRHVREWWTGTDEPVVPRPADLWHFRQTLVFALELDTVSALKAGVKREAIETFDELVRQDADKAAEK